MTLVGPRPERPAFCAEFEKRIPGWHYRTMVTPGLSGLAQVTGGYDLLPKEKVVLGKGALCQRRRPRRGGDDLMARLIAELSAAFSHDLKKKARRRNWGLVELQKLINLVLDNMPESMDALKRRHNIHRSSGA